MKPTATLAAITTLIFLLTGCLMPESGQVGLQPTTLPQDSATPAGNTQPNADPALPVLLLQQPVDGATLYLIRYMSGGQVCLSASFDQRMFATQRCGAANNMAVGFVDTLTHPTGREVRIVYGMVNDLTISAIAVEFANGTNSNTFTENGGYAMVLVETQTPRLLHGVNQYGNLVSSWPITN